jgi:hypothetical protein
MDGTKVGAGLVVGLAIVELELGLGLYFGLNGLRKAIADKIHMATSWKIVIHSLFLKGGTSSS